MEFIPLSPRVDDGNTGREDAARDADASPPDQGSPLPPPPKLMSAGCGGLGIIVYDPRDFALGLPIEPRSGLYRGVVASGKTRIYPDKAGVATADGAITITIDPETLPKQFSVPFEMADGRVAMVTALLDMADVVPSANSVPPPGWAILSLGPLRLSLKHET